VTGAFVKKVAQNVTQSIFLKINTVEKRSPIICAISVIFTKQPKVNSHPIGENLPNLVTLASTSEISSKNILLNFAGNKN
jgi:hypothetical protein